MEKDAALERRFQPVLIDEPSVEETIEILNGLRDRFEAYHRARISPEALVGAAELSDRYILEVRQPAVDQPHVRHRVLEQLPATSWGWSIAVARVKPFLAWRRI